VGFSRPQHSLEVAPKAYLSPVDPLVWLVFLAWLFDFAQRRENRVRLPPIVILFLAFAALSIVRSVNRLNALKDLFQFVEYFAVGYVLFTYYGALPGGRRRLVDVFLAAATAVLLLGAFQYLAPSVAPFDVRATFSNRNVFGGYLALVLPLAGGLLLHEPRWGRRAWYLLILAAGSAVTLSGATLLAVLSALGLIAVGKGWKTLVIVAAVAGLAAALAAPRLPRENGRIARESIRLYDDRNQVALRYTEWQAAADMAARNPWLGVGIGNYQDCIGQYYGILPRPPVAAEPDSQNLYLVLLASTGYPGLACFLGVLFFFALGAARRYVAATDRFGKGLALGTLGSLAAFTVNSVWSPLLVRGIGLPLVLIFALAGTEKNGKEGIDEGT